MKIFHDIFDAYRPDGNALGVCLFLLVMLLAVGTCIVVTTRRRVL